MASDTLCLAVSKIIGFIPQCPFPLSRLNFSFVLSEINASDSGLGLRDHDLEQQHCELSTSITKVEWWNCLIRTAGLGELWVDAGIIRSLTPNLRVGHCH